MHGLGQAWRLKEYGIGDEALSFFYCFSAGCQAGPGLASCHLAVKRSKGVSARPHPAAVPYLIHSQP